MLSSSALSPTTTFHASSSSRGGVDFRSRLDRAKHQYEHLLLHAGSNLLVDEFSHSNSSHPIPPVPNTIGHANLYSPPPVSSYKAAPLSESHSHYPASSTANSDYPLPVEELSGFQQNVDDLASRFQASGGFGGGGGPLMSNEEKNDIIVQLQDENDRLRQQLSNVTASSQQHIQEAHFAQDDIAHNYEHRMKRLESRNQELEGENEHLREMLSRSQREVDEERIQLKKTLQILDKMKRHSRDYLEVQKKTHQILTSSDGLHYTLYMKNHHHHNTTITTNNNNNHKAAMINNLALDANSSRKARGLPSRPTLQPTFGTASYVDNADGMAW